jgi:beta-galactosidase
MFRQLNSLPRVHVVSALLALGLASGGCGDSGSSGGSGGSAPNAGGQPTAGNAGAGTQAGEQAVGGSSAGTGGSTATAGTGGDAITGGSGGTGGGATVDPRTTTTLSDGWKFKLADVTGAEQPSFDDAGWEAVTVPHCFKPLEGQDGPATKYYRGIGWYRARVKPDAALMGKRVYLQFDGSNIITDVWLNGMSLGKHAGGFAAFRFDVTDIVKLGEDNVLAVKVNNQEGATANHVLIPESPTASVPPLTADFTFFGGLYRSVHLVAAAPLSVSLMDYASPGVYIKQSNVSAASADLAITVKLSNQLAEAAKADISALVIDAAGATVQTLTGSADVPAAGKADALLSGKVMNPHLWNGLADPYRYSVRVEVRKDGALVDAVTQPLGLRSISLNANTGFQLNGKYLDLHGVNKHQDHKDKGWAISDADTDADFAIIKEIGATTVRLAHYQHAQHTYDVADALGTVVWAEMPLVNRINDTPAFAANAEQQLVELIRQNYNHPSIAFWSYGNETLLRTGPDPNTLLGHLADVVKAEDPTRLAAYAAAGGSDNVPANFHGDAHGFNKYFGWYSGKVSDFGGWADGLHQTRPDAPLGVSEYGAGGSLMQHVFNPAAKDTGADQTPSVHTEEYQAYFHENTWAQMRSRQFLWGKYIWALFDFPSDTRSEGDAPGLNDKGIVGFDHTTKKDAFYFYKAVWSSEPFVYITSRRFAGLPAAGKTIRVYSNQPSVTLSLNGASLGAKTSTDHIFTWTNVTWANGQNVVKATAGDAADAPKDEVTWTK